MLELPRPVSTLTQGVNLQVVYDQAHDSYEKNLNLIQYSVTWKSKGIVIDSGVC